MLNKNVAELLNTQVNKEFYSAYLYLDFANFYEAKGLNGFANWYKIQAQEERDHALLFYQYLHNNNETVTLEAIAKPDVKMEELIKKHGAIMDQYDPEKKIGMIIDEWGTWFTCEPGSNPGFLYQQNTVRDALVAGVTMNIFNKHCDRVKMACIAQTVNVLQAMILTEGEKMIKTPTYYVFHMYRHHQGANLISSELTGVEDIGMGEWYVPQVTESVSEKDGIITITLNNLSATDCLEMDVQFTGDRDYEVVEANVVTHQDMHAYNTFEEPDRVKEETFDDYILEGGRMKLKLPACSVMEIRVK